MDPDPKLWFLVGILSIPNLTILVADLKNYLEKFHNLEEKLGVKF